MVLNIIGQTLVYIVLWGTQPTLRVSLVCPFFLHSSWYNFRSIEDTSSR